MQITHRPIRRSLVAILAVSGLAASVSAQSLADIAKQTEAQRKAVAHPSKLLTNADIKPDPLSVPPSLLRTMTTPARAVEPPTTAPAEASRQSGACNGCDRDANGRATERGEPARRESQRGFQNGRQGWTGDQLNPAPDDRFRIPPTVDRSHPVRQVCGVNTPREQAMANYMHAAGYPASNCP